MGDVDARANPSEISRACLRQGLKSVIPYLLQNLPPSLSTDQEEPSLNGDNVIGTLVALEAFDNARMLPVQWPAFVRVQEVEEEVPQVAKVYDCRHDAIQEDR